jgi:hypothetical protein
MVPFTVNISEKQCNRLNISCFAAMLDSNFFYVSFSPQSAVCRSMQSIYNKKIGRECVVGSLIMQDQSDYLTKRWPLITSWKGSRFLFFANGLHWISGYRTQTTLSPDTLNFYKFKGEWIAGIFVFSKQEKTRNEKLRGAKKRLCHHWL